MSSKNDPIWDLLCKLKQNNVGICSFLEQEGKYCPNYREKIEGIGSGGFCVCEICQQNNNQCPKCCDGDNKIFDCDLGIPIDENWSENQFQSQKIIESISKNHSIEEWLFK